MMNPNRGFLNAAALIFELLQFIGVTQNAVDLCDSIHVPIHSFGALCDILKSLH